MPFKFLALGDSYTIGECVREHERWPVQLAASLNTSGIDVLSPHIIAQTGWATDELWKEVNSSDMNGKYDLVSLLIGVNNQYRGYSIDEYKIGFEKLLQFSIEVARNKDKVFVLSIPDYGVTPFAEDKDPLKISKEIDQFNKVNKEVCENYNIPYFDITPISRRAAHDQLLIASDGLHPSAEMYKLWTDLIYPIVRGKLKE